MSILKRVLQSWFKKTETPLGATIIPVPLDVDAPLMSGLALQLQAQAQAQSEAQAFVAATTVAMQAAQQSLFIDNPWGSEQAQAQQWNGGTSGTLTINHLRQASQSIGTRGWYYGLSGGLNYMDYNIPAPTQVCDNIRSVMHECFRKYNIEIQSLELLPQTFDRLRSELGSMRGLNIDSDQINLGSSYGLVSIRKKGSIPKFNLDKYMEDVNASLP